MADQVEAALEELYSLAPAEFTKRRDEIAKQLKKVGDKDGAAVIAARKKPTQMAWVLNQLARSAPDAVADLVDVGRELAREQRKALRGEASHGLRESIDRQRKAIAEAGKKAAEVMRELGVDPMAHLQEVTMALQAALVDPAVGAALEAGRLEKAPEAAVGFGGAMAPAADSEPAHAPAKRKSEAPPKKFEPPRDELAERRKQKKADAEEAEAERKREEAAREKEAARKRAHAAHAKSVADATAVLRAAEREAEEARAKAEAAASEAEAAELVAKKAREAAVAAKKNAETLAAEVPRAERTAAAAQKELTRLEANAPA